MCFVLQVVVGDSFGMDITYDQGIRTVLSLFVCKVFNVHDDTLEKVQKLKIISPLGRAGCETARRLLKGLKNKI
jgi:hypothetical protein